MKIPYKSILVVACISCLLFLASTAFAQLTIVEGQVTDQNSGTPLPSVSIWFKGTSIGTITDYDGTFYLQSEEATDTVAFSFLGYQSEEQAVKIGQSQRIEVSLNENSVELDMVEVSANRRDKNPALIFMKQCIENKARNNPYDQDFLEYEVYSKIELDLNNVDEALRDRKMVQRFGFMFEQKVEGDSNTKPYIPVVIAENLGQYYYRKSPKAENEILLASQISGIKNESVQEQLTNTSLKINLYDSYINVFNKGFISPLAETGPLYYRYYFLDSLYINDAFCYKMKIVPRRAEDLVFSGVLWMAKEEMAIVKADLKLSENASINWVNSVKLEQNFQRIDSYFLPESEFTLIDFNLSERNKLTGLYARRNSSYTKIRVNHPRGDSVFTASPALTDSVFERTESYWQEHRHDSLTDQEEVIYTNVDRLQKIPFFMSMKELTTSVLTGYYDFGRFEVGPYLMLATQNPVEGFRMRLGFRTTALFQEKVRYSGHVAYGFGDDRVKYGTGIYYLPKKDPLLGFGINYRYDIEQIGQSESAYPVDHVLGSLLRRRPLDKINLARELNIYTEKEWIRGIKSSFGIKARDVFPNQFDSFNKFGGFIRTTELNYGMRFSRGERILIGDFERSSLGSKKPILELEYAYGLPIKELSDFQYHKAKINIKHRFNLGGLGYVKYYASAGKIWGNLPYVLLNVLPGNENYTFDHLSYNLMNYYEFAVDEYVSLYYTHYFDGLFLNKIPLVKKLDFRELVWGKGIVGGLRSQHEIIQPFPTFLNDLNRPYYEAGFGIENVLKILRFDCFWRLSHLDNPDASRVALRGSLQLKF
ncbi:MAG: DUF5686 and carboxypeptidase-like regulatory domain-containing protein [Salibacteraceae bacterium]